MSEPVAYVDATFYAQVEPVWRNYGYGHADSPPWSAKVTRISQKKPTKPVGGTVLVKLTIRIPKAAFMPLRPEAIVVVPESMTETPPIIVDAEEP